MSKLYYIVGMFLEANTPLPPPQKKKNNKTMFCVSLKLVDKDCKNLHAIR